MVKKTSKGDYIVMIKVGDRVRFDMLKDIKIRGMASGTEFVVGKVIDVIPERKRFDVIYKVGEDDTLLRTSFNFVDIDVSVFPCKRGLYV